MIIWQKALPSKGGAFLNYKTYTMKKVKMLKPGLGPEIQEVSDERATYWKAVGACEILGESDDNDDGQDTVVPPEAPIDPPSETPEAPEAPIDPPSETPEVKEPQNTEAGTIDDLMGDFDDDEVETPTRPQLTIAEVKKMSRGDLDKLAPAFELVAADYPNVTLLREAFIAELP